MCMCEFDAPRSIVTEALRRIFIVICSVSKCHSYYPRPLHQPYQHVRKKTENVTEIIFNFLALKLSHPGYFFNTTSSIQIYKIRQKVQITASFS